MYKIKTTNKFEKDFAKCLKRNLDITDLGEVLEILEVSGKLPRKYKTHFLSGNSAVIWSAISNLIGYLYGVKTIKLE